MTIKRAIWYATDISDGEEKKAAIVDQVKIYSAVDIRSTMLK